MSKLVFITLAIFVFCIQFTKAQTTNEKYQWEFYKEVQGIKIFTKTQELNDPKHGLYQEFIVLKFENTTSNPLNLKWKTEFWYNEKCINCGSDSEEYQFSVSLKANEILEGNVQSSNDLKIFKRFLNYTDKSELTNFELVNIITY